MEAAAPTFDPSQRRGCRAAPPGNPRDGGAPVALWRIGGAAFRTSKLRLGRATNVGDPPAVGVSTGRARGGFTRSPSEGRQ